MKALYSDWEQQSKTLSLTSEKNNSDSIFSPPWPMELDKESQLFSEGLVSVRDLHEYKTLTKKEKLLIMSNELNNFFSINIFGESQVILDFKSLLKKNYPHLVTEYIQHFVSDEINHSKWFSKFIDLYQGKKFSPVFKVKKQEIDSDENILKIFVKIYIFEQISLFYSNALVRDRNVNELVKRINAQHLLEETSHLAFGEAAIKYFVQKTEFVNKGVNLSFKKHIRDFIETNWLSFYNPEIYVGVFSEPVKISDLAFQNPKQLTFRNDVTRTILKKLENIGLRLN
ncbi:MAG: diiron oxygenase [Bdellovibrionaceae bacterium]|nr:diiron oxygenase [Pseudobdellovibrionaceae bacterium]